MTGTIRLSTNDIRRLRNVNEQIARRERVPPATRSRSPSALPSRGLNGRLIRRNDIAALTPASA